MARICSANVASSFEFFGKIDLLFIGVVHMRTVNLNGIDVRVNDEGFINANDLHKASGNMKKNQPSLFTKLDSIKRLINKLNSSLGIPCLLIFKGGATPGTWMHRLLAYEYAGWIDMDFKIGSLNVLDHYFLGNLKPSLNDEMHDILVRITKAENKASFHGRGLNEWKRSKTELHDEAEQVLSRIQIDMF